MSLEAARLTIARDHGYADWPQALRYADVVVDTRFESAADAIQWGELAGLRDLLDGKHPDLRAAEPFFGATARGAARYAGHQEIAELIEERL